MIKEQQQQQQKNIRVGLKVAIVDGFNQLLGHLDDLLFAP